MVLYAYKYWFKMLKQWKFPPLIKARASSTLIKARASSTNCTMCNLATQHPCMDEASSIYLSMDEASSSYLSIYLSTKYGNSHTAAIVLKFQRYGSTRIKVHGSHCVYRWCQGQTNTIYILGDSLKIYLLIKNSRRKQSYFPANYSWYKNITAIG
jgi:hypothetical protein